MIIEEDNHKKQILVGAGILLLLMIGTVSLILGWHFVPGLAGEWLGTIAGVVTTPFFFELSFSVVLFTIVLTLNGWRRHREGDEFVYLDQVSGPEAKSLPDQARWAVFREKPLPESGPTLLELAEGAVAIGDFEHAAAAIAAMSHEQLAGAGVLEVRVALADASGKTALAERLRREMGQRRA